MTASLPFRLARATVFAVVCLGLSVVAHLLGGGSVSAPVLSSSLLLAFGAALAASGRERSPLVVMPLLGGMQVVLHVLFSLSHAPSLHTALAHAHQGLAPSTGMLVAHAWAVVMAGLWLARGEAALWGVVHRMAVRLCRVMLGYLQPLDEPVIVVPAPEPGRLRSAVLAHAAPRRGPPLTRVIAFSS